MASEHEKAFRNLRRTLRESFDPRDICPGAVAWDRTGCSQWADVHSGRRLWYQRRCGTNSLGTALSTSGVGNGPMKGPLLGTSPAIDCEEAKVEKMIGSICRGC
jgi:hypothetical protein